MTKTLTKEELAAKLDRCDDVDSLHSVIQSAKENNFVIVFGASDDLVEFRGAIDDEEGAYNGRVIDITNTGLPKNECDDEHCPYYKRYLETARKNGEVRQIKIFWCGKCKGEKMDTAKYTAIGTPAWCYETDIPHAVFSMYEAKDELSPNKKRSYYCRGIVIDLDQF